MRTVLRKTRMRAAVVSAMAFGLLLVAGPAWADDLELDPRFAREYAALFDVSEEEATWRLSLPDDVDIVRERARAEQPEAFAGARIQHEPEYAVIISTTEPGGLDAGALTRRTLIPADILRVERVDGSPSLVPRGDPTAQAEPAMSIYAGLPTSPSCTLGFAVEHVSGTDGILSAGNCPDNLRYQGILLPHETEAWSLSSDIQWHTIPDGLILRPWARDNFPFGYPPFARPITSSVPRSQPDIGDFVCKFGRVTGFGCGVIVSRTRCPSWVPSCFSTFIQVDGGLTDLATGGDSGGPVFFGTQAWGLISGAAGANNVDDLIYMPINYIWLLGLTVLTS